MKPRPPVVRVLDASIYTKIAGDLRKNLPGKVIIEIDRVMNAEGKKIVLLRCRQPETAKKVIDDVLGEEYIEPEMDEDFAPRKEWWQRSIDSGMGGRSRDSDELRKSMSSYARQFQGDVLKMRKRMEDLRRGSS